MLIAAAICSASCFAECTPPASLQANLQSHPDASTYSNLGTWYGERHEFKCANQAFRSALKLEPKSAKLHYFLGLSLYSSGEVEASIAPLQNSIALDASAEQPRLLLAAVLARLGRRGDAEDQWRAVL